MSKRWIIALKVLLHALCLAPIAHLAWRFFYAQDTFGADPTNYITHFTGNWALSMLMYCLAITPVRRLSTRLGWLIRFRRMLGLYAFFYATLHLITYIWLFSGFNVASMIDDIQKRWFIMVGLFGWLVLLLLALTSPTWALRKMGGRRWQLLHRSIYLAAMAGVIHYWLLVKAGVRSPMPFTLVLGGLLLARIAWSLWNGRKKRAKLRSAAVSTQTA